jgi:hypothetical protein
MVRVKRLFSPVILQVLPTLLQRLQSILPPQLQRVGCAGIVFNCFLGALVSSLEPLQLGPQSDCLKDGSWRSCDQSYLHGLVSHLGNDLVGTGRVPNSQLFHLPDDYFPVQQIIGEGAVPWSGCIPAIRLRDTFSTALDGSVCLAQATAVARKTLLHVEGQRYKKREHGSCNPGRSSDQAGRRGWEGQYLMKHSDEVPLVRCSAAICDDCYDRHSMWEVDWISRREEPVGQRCKADLLCWCLGSFGIRLIKLLWAIEGVAVGVPVLNSVVKRVLRNEYCLWTLEVHAVLESEESCSGWGGKTLQRSTYWGGAW